MADSTTFRSTWIATACALTASVCAMAQAPKKIHVPEGELAVALRSFAAQADVELVYTSSALEGLRTPGLRGEYTTEEALAELLRGTQLKVVSQDGRAMLVSTGTGTRTRTADDRMRFAQAQSGGTDRAPPSRTASAVDSPPRDGVTEVIVTAQKRSENLQTVPVPVTAINTDSLINSNQLQIQDYYTRIPGLIANASGIYEGSVISIRGITSGASNDGTTTVLIDDVPYVNSSALGPGEIVPEVDPSELVRLEVLRGPQGTLYGASSMGGLLKYVTIEPSLEKFSARLQGGLSTVSDGDDLGYSVRGSLNVPLSHTWAVRASAFVRRDPGYIDDPVHGIKDLNSADARGGRVSALWRPSENLSVKLSALFQSSDADGSTYVNAIPGLAVPKDLKQLTVPGSGGYSKDLQVYSANLTAQLGNTELTSVTAFMKNRNEFFSDFSTVYGTFATRFFGVAGAPTILSYDTKKFTQELRLSVPLGERITWLVGGFFDDEDVPQDQRVLAVNFDTGAPAGELAFLDIPSTYREYAAFSNITVDLTDRFDVQFGGRYGRNRQSLDQLSSGPLFGGTLVAPRLKSEDSSFTYLVTPRFRFSEDLMVYARLSSGYRPGGPNTNASLGVPAEFGPDSTRNYEIGFKGDVLDKRLTFDASVYYISWKDLLITLSEPSVRASYKANAGRAKSQGVDLSIELRPITGITVAAWGAWNIAELTENFPATSSAYGISGDRLPFSSRFSGSLSVDGDFPVGETLRAFAGASASYVGDRVGPFTGTAARESLPSYTKVDIRAGLRRDSWTVSLYMNNVTDERGLLNGGRGNFLPTFYNYIPPRSAGLSLVKTF